MEPLSLTVAGAAGLFGLGLAAARRRRASAAPAALAAAAPPEAFARRLELRVEALEAEQAALVARVGEAGPDGPAERRLQAMAGQILGLVRDKDASLATALAGLEQLRARLRLLEQMGAPAEARALFDGLGGRIDGLEAARAAAEIRLAALEASGSPVAALAERLAELHAQRDAAAAAALARLAPLEARLGELEAGLAARDPREALARLGERLEALAARVAEGEGGTAEAAARAEAQAIAVQLVAARAADEGVRLFADRLALLEASLPRLSEAQAAMLAALERSRAAAGAAGPEPRSEPPSGLASDPGPAPAQDPVTNLASALPRRSWVVSVHGRGAVTDA
jgi:hypothetical protein